MCQAKSRCFLACGPGNASIITRWQSMCDYSIMRANDILCGIYPINQCNCLLHVLKCAYTVFERLETKGCLFHHHKDTWCHINVKLEQHLWDESLYRLVTLVTSMWINLSCSVLCKSRHVISSGLHMPQASILIGVGIQSPDVQSQLEEMCEKPVQFTGLSVQLAAVPLVCAPLSVLRHLVQDWTRWRFKNRSC